LAGKSGRVTSTSGVENDRLEVFDRIVGGLLVEPLVLRVGADAAEHELVTVGRGLGDAARSGHPTGAGDILDQDLLAENFRGARGERAGEHVNCAAGGKGHHHGHRPVGEVLRGCRRNERQQRERSEGCEGAIHLGSPGATIEL
jgi:hypothetical protein